MALCLTHKRNQGAHIEGNGVSIDLILRAVLRHAKPPAVDFEVRGIGNSQTIRLQYGEDLVRLVEGHDILMGVSKKRTLSNCQVTVAYSAPMEYNIVRRDYEC